MSAQPEEIIHPPHFVEIPERLEDDRAVTDALAVLREVEAKIAANQARADEEILRAREWLHVRNESLIQRRDAYRALLTEHHRAILEKDPEAKTIHYPGGELKARKLPDQWDFDAEVFVEWASAQDRFLRHKIEIDKATAKKALKARAGKVVDPETGELVPGIDVIPGEVRHTVEVAS